MNLRNMVLASALTVGAIASTGCHPGGYVINSNNYSQSQEGRIMSNILEYGEEKTTRTGNGKITLYRAREFMHGENKVVAHVVTFMGEAHGNGLPGFRQVDSQYINGKFENMLPHIAFEIFEKKKDKFKITYLMDQLTNNNEKMEDIVLVINQERDNFILPHNMPKDKVSQISPPPLLYAQLRAKYKKRFLQKGK